MAAVTGRPVAKLCVAQMPLAGSAVGVCAHFPMIARVAHLIGAVARCAVSFDRAAGLGSSRRICARRRRSGLGLGIRGGRLICRLGRCHGYKRECTEGGSDHD